jgi:endo-1,4-beta-xylanase
VTTRARAAAALVAALLAACGGGGGDPTGPSVQPPTTNPPTATATPLRQLITDRGHRIRVGAAAGALFNRTDAAGTQFMTVLAREFNVLTAENDMKPDALQPSRGAFRWARADSMVDFAARNGMTVRGHTLVWHNQLPAWLSAASLSADQLRTAFDEHITAAVGHFRGKLIAWDVVNEAVDDAGALRGASTIWGRLGREYIERAFRVARAADPNVALFYNDYSLEWPGAKQDSVYALLRDLKARGVPVDGIGFQGHFIAGGGTPSRAALEQTFRRFAELGLKIHVTELDVRMPMPATDANLQAQAQNYRAVFEACAAVPACEMVVTWGLTDLSSWIPTTFPGQGDALLFDAAFRPKPAYTAVNDFLAGR